MTSLPRLHFCVACAPFCRGAAPASADVQLRHRDGQRDAQGDQRDGSRDPRGMGESRADANRQRRADARRTDDARADDVTEEQALEVMLRSVAGYMTAPRASALANASQFDRILVMPTSSPTRPGTPPPQPANFRRRAAAVSAAAVSAASFQGRFRRSSRPRFRAARQFQRRAGAPPQFPPQRR